MTTAVTYLRVSSADQVQNTSLDDQDERTKKHVADKGWTFLRAFREEGVSAKTDDRPQLKALYQFCAENDVDYVVSVDMSRISRDTEAYLRIRRTLAAVGTKLSFISFDPGDTPEGEFIATVTAAASQLENRLRGVKSKRGMEATMKAGGWVAHAPIGYRCVRVDGLPSLEYADGYLDVLAAFSDVADGRKTVKEAARSLGISKASEFFSRPVYAGYNEINGELVKGKWPAIVPLAVWYRVQERLKHRAHHKQSDFWLRGFLVCECGQKLTASYSQGRHRKYGYYHCRKCKARHPARELEERFKTWLDDLAIINAKVFADVRKRMADHVAEMLAAAEEAKKRAVEKSQQIAKRLSALIDMRLDEAIGKDEYEAKRQELVEKRKEIERALAVGTLNSDQYFVLLENAEHILTHFTEFLGKAGHEDLLTVVRALVGSTVCVWGNGNLSNRENDGLYWLKSTFDSPKNGMAPPTVGVSNRILAARLEIARTIFDNVLGEAR